MAVPRLSPALLALAPVVSACGRIAFDPLESTAIVPGPLTVIVTHDEYTQHGAPRGDVMVLFEAPDGAITELRTDAAGVAMLLVDGPSTAHVIVQRELGPPATFLVQTVLGLGGGATVRIGGDGTRTPRTATLSVTVPNHPSALGYSASSATGCDLFETSFTETITPMFAEGCAGKTLDVYAHASDSSGLLGWQAQTASIDDGGMIGITGVWQPPVQRRMFVTGLSDMAYVWALYHTRTPAGDWFNLSYSSAQVQAVNGSAMTDDPTVGTTAQLAALDVFEGPNVRSAVEPVSMTTGSFDARRLPPPITRFEGNGAAIEWELDVSAWPATGIETLANVDTVDGSSVEWRVLAPAQLGSVRYPKLPSSLAGLDPRDMVDPFALAYAVAFQVPGMKDHAAAAARVLLDSADNPRLVAGATASTRNAAASRPPPARCAGPIPWPLRAACAAGIAAGARPHRQVPPQ